MTTYTVTVDAEGRLSLPDDIAGRWCNRVVVVDDLGDRLVMRDVTGTLRGRYRGRGPSTLDAREIEREG